MHGNDPYALKYNFFVSLPIHITKHDQIEIMGKKFRETI